MAVGKICREEKKSMVTGGRAEGGMRSFHGVAEKFLRQSGLSGRGKAKRRKNKNPRLLFV